MASFNHGATPAGDAGPVADDVDGEAGDTRAGVVAGVGDDGANKRLETESTRPVNVAVPDLTNETADADAAAATDDADDVAEGALGTPGVMGEEEEEEEVDRDAPGGGSGAMMLCIPALSSTRALGSKSGAIGI